MGGPIVPYFDYFYDYGNRFLLSVSLFKKSRRNWKFRNFVVKVRNLLNKNKVDEAIEECDAKGSVGNVVKEGLTTYKALAQGTTLNKEQKTALTKSIERATTLKCQC